ncbi:MAG: von Willebrand factor [Verrucomicrobiaceae bacterium]|nr:von Willebrand factor [Verrucomicrobiaceae bacterium]
MKPEDITAWALDELTPEERAQIEAALGGTPNLQQQASATKDFCGLLSQHLQDKEAALTAEQRQSLQALDLPKAGNIVTFAPAAAKTAAEEPARLNGKAFQARGTAAREPLQPKPSPWMRLAAVAACLVFILVLADQSRKLGTPTVAVVDTPRERLKDTSLPAPAPTVTSADVRVAQAKKAAPKLAALTPLPDLQSDQFLETPRIAGQPSAAEMANVKTPANPAGMITADSSLSPAAPAKPALTIGGLASTTGGRPLDLNGTATMSGSISGGAGTLNSLGKKDASGMSFDSGSAAIIKSGNIVQGGNSPQGSTLADNITVGGGTMTPAASGGLSGGLALTQNASKIILSGGNTYTGATTINGGATTYNTEPTGGYLAQADIPAPALSPEHRSHQADGYGSAKVSTDAAKASLPGNTTSPAPPMPDRRGDAFAARSLDKSAPREAEPVPSTRTRASPGTESYAKIIENPFTTVRSQPLSTFSIDVDTASYANVRRFLNEGRLPPPDAVRLEEMINYFPYDYEQPGDNEQPFSVHVDVAEAPWAPQHRLARVAIKGRDVGLQRKAANFVFLIDVSGSMQPAERLPLIKQGLEMLTEQLQDDDRVSIVTYAGACAVALESTSGANKATIMGVIRGLHAGGSTNGESGITMAYQQAEQNFIKDGINRVILCTDGDFNVGISDPHQLERLIKEKAKGGTFLSVLGVGRDNLQDRTMETLADNGNGNYAYLDSLGEARKVLVEQMHGTLITIAKDVKIQVEFNPAVVASYRLIGYEKRMLAAQDFNNDKKDAGEIGAGHTITALYEIIPAGLPMPNGALAEVDDLKYQKQNEQPKTPPMLDAKPPQARLEGINDEIMTVKLRYKAPDGQLSKLIEYPVHDAGKTLKDAPRDFRFATAVAGFGMLLRDSEHAENFSYDAVRRLALSGKGEDALGYRGEFIQLIDKARGLTVQQ